jgi:hypothetical protein
MVAGGSTPIIPGFDSHVKTALVGGKVAHRAVRGYSAHSPMRRLLHRIPLKESAAAVIVCAIVFLSLLAARAVVSRCYDHKGRLDRHH